MNNNCNRLSVMGLGWALGVTWGLGILLTGLAAWYFPNWGGAFVSMMGSVYIGFDASLSGSLIGGLYGLVDGFIGGVIIAWLYNLCFKCCHK